MDEVLKMLLCKSMQHTLAEYEMLCYEKLCDMFKLMAEVNEFKLTMELQKMRQQYGSGEGLRETGDNV